jgi:Zn-dependent protease
MTREPWRESLDEPTGGSWRGVLRRVFGDGENPLRWGFPLYSAWGIRVRIHVFFVFYIVAECIRALTPDSAGLLFVVPILLALFGLVLLHEYGHCLACRRVGGEADEILMWPLGGLASCLPPHRWAAHFWTTAGGPLVNAVLLLPLAGLAWLATREMSAVVFNPFDPGPVVGLITAGSTVEKFFKIFLWALHYSNMVLLAFNVLVPMYPMDGGRLLQAVLWAKMGYRDSMRVACVVGLVAAGVLAVFSIVFEELTLLAIALLGGIVCYSELHRLKFEQGDEPGIYAAAYEQEVEDAGPSKAEIRAEEKARSAEAAEIDRILEKISAVAGWTA